MTLACRGAGTGRVRAMLLHGFPEAAFVWDGVLQRLAPQVAAVAPNLRGYIGSSAPTEVAAYRAKCLVGDVAAAIDALGPPLDLLVAHDWGGALAWNLAAQRPELIKQLLIVNSPHPAAFLRELRHSAEQQTASAYMTYLCRPGAEQQLAEDDFRRLWPFLGEPAWLTPAVRAQYRQAWLNQGRGLTGALNYYRASPLRPPTGADDPLHQLQPPDAAVTSRVPTTVLWGERDAALRPSLLTGLERWVPQLQLVHVPDASHWIVHEQPRLVTEVIVSLLGGSAAG
ncbi:MAG: alpha/beta fold hydrolase [Rubrivivax sp.]|nr:alpha/beta fold hydrolase [Rubrivivax sp.]